MKRLRKKILNKLWIQNHCGEKIEKRNKEGTKERTKERKNKKNKRQKEQKNNWTKEQTNERTKETDKQTKIKINLCMPLNYKHEVPLLIILMT